VRKLTNNLLPQMGRASGLHDQAFCCGKKECGYDTYQKQTAASSRAGGLAATYMRQQAAAMAGEVEAGVTY
jgi:hypothetical protein